MLLNADFKQRAVIRPADYRWVASPMPGVERMMLDRIGGEVARATSLVRYAPNSRFSPHVHEGGEEFLVLEGEFGDEYGVYPAGTYVRNPVGTRHAPRVGDQGCTILVKLHQFAVDDRTQAVIDTHDAVWQAGPQAGVRILPLHAFAHERVALVRWAPDTALERHAHPGGEEVFVIEGSFGDELGDYPSGSWVRSPPGSEHSPATRSEGALLYVKIGHLE